MYRFLDRRLDELDNPSAFLLAAMRGWVTSVQAARCPCGITLAHFEQAGMQNVADDFGMAMFILNGEGLQRLHLGHPGCARVRDDEARLLALFTCAIDNDRGAVYQLASTLVDDRAVSRLIQAVSIVAAQIAASYVSTRFD